MRVAIIDFGMGNLRSVEKAFHKVGADGAFVTDDPAEVAQADKAVLPGDGAFDSTMRSLRQSGVDQICLEFIASGRPFLGICVGMQVLTDRERGRRAGRSGLERRAGPRPPLPLRAGPQNPADRLEHAGLCARLTAGRGPAGRVADGLFSEFLLLRPGRSRRHRRDHRLRRPVLLRPAPGQCLGHAVSPGKVRPGRPGDFAQFRAAYEKENTMNDAFQALFVLLGSFGGVSLIIWTSMQAKIARIKAEAAAQQMTAGPLPNDSRYRGTESHAAANGADAQHQPSV